MRTYVEAHMAESLKDHVLIPLLHSGVGEVRGFYLKKPGHGRMMSTLILFSPEGIILQGDLTPSRHGDVSSYGYGAQWFSGQLSEDYLCEKFLQKEFVPEKAYETFKEHILSRRREGDAYMTKEKAREAYDANEEHGRAEAIVKFSPDAWMVPCEVLEAKAIRVVDYDLWHVYGKDEYKHGVR